MRLHNRPFVWSQLIGLAENGRVHFVNLADIMQKSGSANSLDASGRKAHRTRNDLRVVRDPPRMT
jgi:hypothetical protein